MPSALPPILITVGSALHPGTGWNRRAHGHISGPAARRQSQQMVVWNVGPLRASGFFGFWQGQGPMPFLRLLDVHIRSPPHTWHRHSHRIDRSFRAASRSLARHSTSIVPYTRPVKSSPGLPSLDRFFAAVIFLLRPFLLVLRRAAVWRFGKWHPEKCTLLVPNQTIPLPMRICVKTEI